MPALICGVIIQLQDPALLSTLVLLMMQARYVNNLLAAVATDVQPGSVAAVGHGCAPEGAVSD